MKIPHSVSPRTRPSSQGLGYLRPAVADTRAITSGLRNVSGAVTDFAARVQDRNDNVERFDALKRYSQFELDTDTAILELKRGAAPSVTDFPDQVNKLYGKMEQEFIRQLPADLQPEFQYRAAQTAQRVRADALTFQFQQQDAFFKTGLSEEYEKAKVALSKSPDQIDAWDARLAELVSQADIPEVVKAEMAKTMSSGLAAVVYGRFAEEIRRGEVTAVGNDAGTIAANLLRSEEGFRTRPYFDVNALRAGFGSDTVTRADGTVETVTADTVVTEEEAELDLARRIQEFTNTAAGQVGDDVWGSLAPNVQAGLISVTYNYGSLPDSVVEAVATGDATQIAQAVAALPANKARRKREASLILGGAASAMEALDNEPLFANLTLEERQAMQADAERKVSAEETERKRLEKEALDAQRNEAFTLIHDGEIGEAGIMALRNAGIFSDIDDITKAEGLLKARREKDDGAAQIQAILDNPALVYNPAVDDEAYNDWLGERGLRRVGVGDQEFIDTAVMPSIERLQDIPTDLVGQLLGMSRANDNAMMRFAYEQLARMEDVAPGAYGQRVPEYLSAKVDAYRNMKGSATEEELFNYLRGGRTPAEVQTSNTLDKEAIAIVQSKPDLLNIVTDQRVGYDASIGNWPAVQMQIEREFISAFKFNYRASRDEDKAKKAAIRQLKRVWNESTVGRRVLMRHPPELVYPRLREPGYSFNPFGATGFEGYEDQVRRDLGLLDGEEFQLVGDDQTDRELEQYRLGRLADVPSDRPDVLLERRRLPSYAVIKYTPDGEPIVMPGRWWGDPNAVSE